MNVLNFWIPSGNKKRKKKRKERERPSPYRSMFRGREKPLFIKLPRVHLNHDLHGHILSSGQPKHTRNSTLVSSGRAGLRGIYQALSPKTQGIILMVAPTFSPPCLWGFRCMYSKASAFLVPKPLLTRAYASAASFHSEISCAVYSSAYAFNN